MAGSPASEALGGSKWSLRRYEGRGRTCRQLVVWRGYRERRMVLHAEPAILGDVQLGRGSLSTRSRQGPVRVLGARPGPGDSDQVPVSPELWHSALHALGPVPGRGQRPQYGLRPESEQRRARAGAGSSRAAAPGWDDNLFHSSYA